VKALATEFHGHRLPLEVPEESVDRMHAPSSDVENGPGRCPSMAPADRPKTEEVNGFLVETRFPFHVTVAAFSQFGSTGAERTAAPIPYGACG
jgi:hypothetical protein